MLALLIGSIATLPMWPYSTRWGYIPTGACGIIAAGMAALIVVGRL